MKVEEAIKKTKVMWDSDPELTQNRDNVLEKYGVIFKLENIDNLTSEKFQEFLKHSENKHWKGISRPGGHLVKDMDKLKKSLKILLDESQPLSNRIKRLRDDGKDHIKNLGYTIYTPILLVSNPQKYSVVNKAVIGALNSSELYSEKLLKTKEEWEYVPEMQKIIQDIAEKNDLDLWQIDWTWWEVYEDVNSKDYDESEFLQFVKNLDVHANYQPIVIKTLLEKGEDAQFTASIEEIKEKIKLLNFDREKFKIGDAISAVFGALEKYVRYDGENASLNFEFDSLSEFSKCLRICGQKIAEWHINEIMKSEYDMWYIMPGSRESNFKYLDEFLKTDSIGVGWRDVGDISNLSDSEIQQKFEEKYEKGWTSFENFTRIKSKDVIVLAKGQEKIIDFGIVVGNYEFRDAVESSYTHRKKIVWLNQGPILASELPRQTLSFIIATCGKLDQRKQEMEKALLDENMGKLSLSNNSELSSMSDNEESELDDQLNPSELTYWPFTQVAKMKQEFIQLGVQLATNFDGKDVSDDTKKDFMIMLENSGIYSSTGDNVSSMEMVTVVKKFGTYQTLLTFYGLGSFQNGKFKISELCKYWLKEKEDLISFARHMALRLQFPNATQIQSHQDEFHAQQIRISPFTLLLQILLKLNNNSQDMAYLSEDEIKAIVFQIRTMGEIDDKVNLILRNRGDNTSYEDVLENFPTKGEESIKRLFPVFDSTELMQLDLSNKPKILKLKKEKIPIINQILNKFEFDFFEWNGNKEDWDNHFGANQ